jgi:hypothetical protein
MVVMVLGNINNSQEAQGSTHSTCSAGPDVRNLLAVFLMKARRHASPLEQADEIGEQSLVANASSADGPHSASSHARTTGGVV